MRAGFVGLGNMGWPMARNLAQAGYHLTVRDADDARQARFVADHGAVAANAPADFAGVDVLVTMLPDDRAVAEAVLEWEGGIAGVLDPGSVVLDMSSSNPRGTRALGEQLSQRGIGLVDAPVSGGVARAETGTLSLMVGGDDEFVGRVQPVLEVLGGPQFRTGPLGSGHAAKALNNFVCAGTYTVTAEALAIGLRFGLDAETMVGVLNGSTGRSFVSEVVFQDHILPGGYGTGFALHLLAKDVGIAADLAEAADLDAPAVGLVDRRWSEAAASLGRGSDHSEAHKQWWPADFTAQARGTDEDA